MRQNQTNTLTSWRRHSLILGICLLVGLSGSGCAKTELKDAWVNPHVNSPWHFNKVVVAVLIKEESTRRIAEDTLVNHFRHSDAVASYSVIPDNETTDVKKITDRLRNRGFDGAVVMRLTGIDKEFNAVPTTGGYPPSTLGLYWNTYQPTAYGPYYLHTENIIKMETSVYSMDDEQLFYAARTNTVNPSDTMAEFNEIAEIIAADLRKKHLIR